MIKHILLGLTAGIALLPTPVAAQRQEKVVVVYGNDKCPTNAAGQEVVVCARRPESERYRIPSELRSSGETQTSGGARVSAMSAGGTAGSTTCSNIGGGGGSNCFANQMRAARAEKKAAKVEAANSPLPQ